MAAQDPYDEAQEVEAWLAKKRAQTVAPPPSMDEASEIDQWLAQKRGVQPVAAPTGPPIEPSPVIPSAPAQKPGLIQRLKQRIFPTTEGVDPSIASMIFGTFARGPVATAIDPARNTEIAKMMQTGIPFSKLPADVLNPPVIAGPRGLGVVQRTPEELKASLPYKQGLAQFAEGMTTPENAGIIGALGIAAPAQTLRAGGLGIHMLVNAGFTLGMLKNVIPIWNQAEQLEAAGNHDEAISAKVNAVLTAGMAALGVKGMAKSGLSMLERSRTYRAMVNVRRQVLENTSLPPEAIEAIGRNIEAGKDILKPKDYLSLQKSLNMARARVSTQPLVVKPPEAATPPGTMATGPFPGPQAVPGAAPKPPQSTVRGQMGVPEQIGIPKAEGEVVPVTGRLPEMPRVAPAARPPATEPPPVGATPPVAPVERPEVPPIATPATPKGAEPTENRVLQKLKPERKVSHYKPEKHPVNAILYLGGINPDKMGDLGPTFRERVPKGVQLQVLRKGAHHGLDTIGAELKNLGYPDWTYSGDAIIEMLADPKLRSRGLNLPEETGSYMEHANFEIERLRREIDDLKTQIGKGEEAPGAPVESATEHEVLLQKFYDAGETVPAGMDYSAERFQQITGKHPSEYVKMGIVEEREGQRGGVAVKTYRINDAPRIGADVPFERVYTFPADKRERFQMILDRGNKLIEKIEGMAPGLETESLWKEVEGIRQKARAIAGETESTESKVVPFKQREPATVGPEAPTTLGERIRHYKDTVTGMLPFGKSKTEVPPVAPKPTIVEKAKELKTVAGKVLRTAKDRILNPGMGVKVHAVAFTPRDTPISEVDFRGAVARNPQEMATLFSGFRNPQHESFMYVYFKDNKILHHEQIITHSATSTDWRLERSRLRTHKYLKSLKEQSKTDYSETNAIGSEAASRTTARVVDRAHRLGADKVVVVHGHPNRRTSPSSGDIAVTRHLDKDAQGESPRNRDAMGEHGLGRLFGGHLIIDHDTFSWIEPGTNARGVQEQVPLKVKPDKDPYDYPIKNHPLNNKEITGLHHLARLIETSMDDISSRPVIVWLRGGKIIQEIETIPRNLFLNEKGFGDYMRGRQGLMGATPALVYRGETTPDIRRAAVYALEHGNLGYAFGKRLEGYFEDFRSGAFPDTSLSYDKPIWKRVGSGKGISEEQISLFSEAKKPEPERKAKEETAKPEPLQPLAEKIKKQHEETHQTAKQEFFNKILQNKEGAVSKREILGLDKKKREAKEQPLFDDDKPTMLFEEVARLRDKSKEELFKDDPEVNRIIENYKNSRTKKGFLGGIMPGKGDAAPPGPEISGWRSVRPAPEILMDVPETAPIAIKITRAEVDKKKAMQKYDDLANKIVKEFKIKRGSNEDEMVRDLLDSSFTRMTPQSLRADPARAGDKEGAIKAAKRMREEVFEPIINQIRNDPELIKIIGEKGYIRGYFPHWAKQLEKDYGPHWEEVARTLLPSQFVSRFLKERKADTWVSGVSIYDIVPGYIHSTMKTVHDIPAYAAARELIDALPTGPAREFADWYAKNYIGDPSVDPFWKAHRKYTAWSHWQAQRYYDNLIGLNFGTWGMNLGQTLINTFPELNGHYVLKGLKTLLTEEGRKTFHESGALFDSPGMEIGIAGQGWKKRLLHVGMSFTEYVNRGIAFHGALEKAKDAGLSGMEAEYYAHDMVSKTQFNYGKGHAIRLLENLPPDIRVFQNFWMREADFVARMALDAKKGKAGARAKLGRFLLMSAAIPAAMRVAGLDYDRWAIRPSDIIPRAYRSVELAGRFSRWVYSIEQRAAKGQWAKLGKVPEEILDGIIEVYMPAKYVTNPILKKLQGGKK